MFVSILLSQQGANMLFNLKTGRTLFALGVLSGCSIYSASVWAEGQPDKLTLKTSTRLAFIQPANIERRWNMTPQTRSVLDRLEFFRGVDVDSTSTVGTQNQQIRRSSESGKSKPMIQAVHGGLQILLSERLSLVYSPGRLSGQRFDSDSQGLYLLTDRGRQANWYVGVESSSNSSSSDNRRAGNSAQFGVILSLD